MRVTSLIATGRGAGAQEPGRAPGPIARISSPPGLLGALPPKGNPLESDVGSHFWRWGPLRTGKPFAEKNAPTIPELTAPLVAARAGFAGVSAHKGRRRRI